MKRLGVLVKDGTKAVLAGVTRERPGGPTTPTASEALKDKGLTRNLLETLTDC